MRAVQISFRLLDSGKKLFRSNRTSGFRLKPDSGKRRVSPSVEQKISLNFEAEKRVEDGDEVVELQHQLRRWRVLGQALAARDESPGHGKHKRVRKSAQDHQDL